MLVASTTGFVGVAVAITFTLSVIGFTIYAIVRPFTHIHYRRQAGKLFDPLD
jgi:hypothetical protein